MHVDVSNPEVRACLGGKQLAAKHNTSATVNISVSQEDMDPKLL